MDLKKTEFYPSLLWLKIMALVCFFGVSLGALSIEHQSKPEGKDIQPEEHPLSKITTRLTKVKYKPWYTKVNYFAQFEQNHQGFSILGSPIEGLPNIIANGEINSPTLSLTAGGNLFSKTSVHLVVSYTESSLAVKNFDKNPIFINIDNELTLAEILVEHSLGKGFTLGLNLYYGGGIAKNDINIIWPAMWKLHPGWTYGDVDLVFESSIDEFGGELKVANAFKLGSSDIQVSYTFNHQQMNSNHEIDRFNHQFSTNFHYLLFNLSHQWSHQLSTDMGIRAFYFPDYDPSTLGSISRMYSLDAEMRYRLGSSNTVSLKVARFNYDHDSYFNTISLEFEYQFDVKKSKRRKRQYKIPKVSYKLPPIMKATGKYWDNNNVCDGDC